MSDDLSQLFQEVNLDKDLQQSKLNTLNFEIGCLQASQKQLLSEVEELKNHLECQNKDKICYKQHHLQTNTSKNLYNNENAGCLLQNLNDLKQKMETQTRMLELTINVYIKEKSQCNDEFTKDELQMQKRLHKLMAQRIKRQKW
jgi:hypothetical protein